MRAEVTLGVGLSGSTEPVAECQGTSHCMCHLIVEPLIRYAGRVTCLARVTGRVGVGDRARARARARASLDCAI